jgi:hypothetical protein
MGGGKGRGIISSTASSSKRVERPKAEAWRVFDFTPLNVYISISRSSQLDQHHFANQIR